MAGNIWKQVQEAISHLNPQEARNDATRPVQINLVADTPTAYEQMEAFFSPPGSPPDDRVRAFNVLRRDAQSVPSGTHRLDVYWHGLPHPAGGFTFEPGQPQQVVCDILDHAPDLSLALARSLPPFRPTVVNRIVQQISKENALFSLATAVPDILPLISLPWAVGEFASDTVVLTMNQVRMAFLLGAANGCPLGYGEQKGEIASIVASAFGWRALARELVGKIPLGGGLIPKAAIAYAGTYVIGHSIDRYQRFGKLPTKVERRSAYDYALEQGKAVAGALMESLHAKKRGS
jgi:uncharacterized protein (DUF697 family)